MKIQFCAISVLSALCSQAMGKVFTMEIIFNDFSRKRSLLFPPLWSPPHSCCAHTSLHHWKPLACGNAGLMEWLALSSLGRKASFILIMPVPYSRANWNRKEYRGDLFLPVCSESQESCLAHIPISCIFALALTQKFPRHRELCYPDHTCSQTADESRFPLAQKSCKDMWQ